MLDFCLRVQVFPKEGKKPLFERVIHRSQSEDDVDFNVITRALRILFGKSSTIQFSVDGY